MLNQERELWHSDLSRAYKRIGMNYANWHGDRSSELLFLNKTLDQLPKKPKILDLGCGAGGTVLELLSTRGHVLGIDISQEQVDRASKRYPHAEFQCAAAEDFRYESLGMFDLIVAHYVLFHILDDDRYRLLKKLSCLVSTEGRLSCCIPKKTSNKRHGTLLGERVPYATLSWNKFEKSLDETGWEMERETLIASHISAHHLMRFMILRPN